MRKRAILVMGMSILTIVSALIIEDVNVRSAEAQSRGSQAKTYSAPVKYDPPSREEAPPNIREAVITGYNIMNHTRHYAGEYDGNVMNCSNCHFKEGSYRGGKNGGISLVGVNTQYPKYSKEAGGVIDLASRINACFERNMNGKPLPPDSKLMVGLIAYFQWISKGLPAYGKIPWLGLKELRSAYRPNVDSGFTVFKTICATCHGGDGMGTKIAPPLWGNESFSDGSQMTNIGTLAAFVHNNMPYRVANLTKKQAIDVAAFILSHPRAHYPK